jgi:hypothetical protein
MKMKADAVLELFPAVSAKLILKDSYLDICIIPGVCN